MRRQRAGVRTAPGRANLMGEHTDYNQGLVLPFAIAQSVTAAAVRRDDSGLLVLRSRQAPAEAVGHRRPRLAGSRHRHRLGGLPGGRRLGAARRRVPDSRRHHRHQLRRARGRGPVLIGRPRVRDGARADRAAPGRCVPRRELVKIARRAENDFIGVPSGIMDQSASLLCEAGHALLLDCGTLEISQVPFDPAAAGIGLLVIDTRAEHTHAAGTTPGGGRNASRPRVSSGCRSSAA